MYALLISPAKTPISYSILSVFADISPSRFSSTLIWSITIANSLEWLLNLICFIKHLKPKCFTKVYKAVHDVLRAYLPLNTYPLHAL